MRNYNRFTAGVLCLLILLGIGCEENNHVREQEPQEIDFSIDSSRNNEKRPVADEKQLYVAVSAMTSPKETFTYYQELIDYIATKIGRPIIFKQRKTYQEVNDMLENRTLHFAFVCSGAYVQARKRFPLDILAVPVVNGQPFYQAYFIVHKNSPIKNFRELRGKSFAFTDPLSHTGYLCGLEEVRKLGSHPDNFFRKTIFTYAHDYSIQAVARGIVDGATVESLIFEYLKRTHPERVADVKIIGKTPFYGIPPVVIHHEANPLLKQKLQDILYHMHEDSLGNSILSKLAIDRFEPGQESNYLSIEELLENFPQ